MNVLILGATGMVGQGVLRESLGDPDVRLVQAVGRTAIGARHPKLREVLRQDLANYQAIEPQLTGCWFCLGVSSSGMTEQAYERVTNDFTLAAAQTLCRVNPQMVFIYVSGAGTDSSEHGRSMWAHVKGKTKTPCSACPLKPPTCSAPASSSRSTPSGRKRPHTASSIR